VSEPLTYSASDVAGAIGSVRERIVTAGGALDQVTVVAVTKGLSLSAARAAAEAGELDIGENYASELEEKASALAASPGVRWHLLGGIQRRSVARVARYVTLYQSVDRIEEGETIAKHAAEAAVLVEVDTTNIAGRGGVSLDEAPRLAERLSRLGLDVKGLMTIGPPDDPDGSRRAFSSVRKLVDRLGLPIASMGMSDDFEIAVKEGSTMVRVGRAIFGLRPARNPLSQ